jgi:guanylate kinase
VQEAVEALCLMSQSLSEGGKDPTKMMENMHMVFFGPAGVGKSETARRFGKVLYNLRVIVSVAEVVQRAFR